jgi:polyisoprenoid-binding protein YceI
MEEVMLAALTALALATPVQLSFATGSQVVVNGDSNAHPWTCQTAVVQPTASHAELPAPATPNFFNLRVTIPVKDLSCGNGTMEEKLRDALKAEQFPNIEFALITMKKMQDKGPDHFYEVTGGLTIAGKTKPISFSMKASPEKDGTLASTASVNLLMSEFGVEAPSAFLGLMKTYDPVVVKLLLRAKLAALTN